MLHSIDLPRRVDFSEHVALGTREQVQPVPEPTSLLAIFVVAAFGKVFARKRKFVE
ncbi:MAG: PEP-CTERM sorting domain-containing protein [Geitlerinemataceae cyanobacterium]